MCEHPPEHLVIGKNRKSEPASVRCNGCGRTWVCIDGDGIVPAVVLRKPKDLPSPIAAARPTEVIGTDTEGRPLRPVVQAVQL